ncbi:hypothetical protein [Dechloromonas sp. TW-R-39-2]|nr:hypothetical protein [Dechloromonas sp. TW-R-39-2]
MSRVQILSMIFFWSAVLAVDMYASINPPPEPVQLGREAWDLS